MPMDKNDMITSTDTQKSYKKQILQNQIHLMKFYKNSE